MLAGCTFPAGLPACERTIWGEGQRRGGLDLMSGTILARL